MATAGIINGTNLALFVDVSGTLTKIANLVSNDLTFTKDLIETTSKSSAGSKEFMYGHFGASGSFEGRFEDDSVSGTEYSFEQLFDAQVAGTSLTVVFTTNTTGDLKFEGTALLSSLSLSSPDNDAASFSGDVTISGAITKGTVA
ncbi:phage tail tube protein [Yeosuana sp.]|jgi:predicted secreted protein|uniref:phage tail tube protein n=1 Tax=Yeosuana sp. TaxID=2529388 RepID=UPI0040552FB9